MTGQLILVVVSFWQLFRRQCASVRKLLQSILQGAPSLAIQLGSAQEGVDQASGKGAVTVALLPVSSILSKTDKTNTAVDSCS